MTLPPMSNATEALEAAALMRHDERLAEIVRWTATSGGLAAMARHALEADVAPDEDEHRRTIAASWQGLADDLRTNALDEPDDVVSRATRAWDVRLGKERDFIPTSAELLPPGLAALVYGLAESWGMTAPVEPHGHFDVVMPIGGLIRANLARPAAAAAWLRSGQATTDQVVGLAGDRRFSPKESALAAELGVAADDEPSGLRAGLERAFDLDAAAWADAEPGVVTNLSGAVPVRFAATPMQGERRATTGQAIEWYRGHGLLSGADSLLVVTTPIYWIANHIAVRTAVDASMRLTTTGYGEEYAPAPRQVFRSQHYLQEIKAALEALPRVERWAAEAG